MFKTFSVLLLIFLVKAAVASDLSQSERVELRTQLLNPCPTEDVWARLLAEGIAQQKQAPAKLAQLYLTQAECEMFKSADLLATNIAKAKPLFDPQRTPDLFVYSQILESFYQYTYRNRAEEAIAMLEVLSGNDALQDDLYLYMSYLQNLLELYYKQHAYERIAEPLFKFAQEFEKYEAQQCDQPGLRLHFLGELSHLAGKSGDVEQAKQLSMQMVKQLRQNDEKFNIAVVYANLSNLDFLPFAEQVDFARKALIEDPNVYCADRLKKMIELADAQDGKFSAVEASPAIEVEQGKSDCAVSYYYYSARIFLLKHDLDAAERMAGKASMVGRWQHADLMQRIHRQRGEFDKALAAAEDLMRLREQAAENARRLMSASYQVRLKLAQDEAKAAEQAKQAEKLAAAEEKAQARLTLMLTAIAAGCMVIFVLVLYLYRSRRFQQKLQQLSDTDPLTGLLNRRAFLRQAEQLQLLAQRQQFPLSMALIDLDLFKQINDQQGHQTGDAVLRAFANAAKATLRQTDIIGRFGGEEFVLMSSLPNSTELVKLLQRLHECFQQMCLQDKQIGFDVSFSAGTAELCHQAVSQHRNIEEAIREADQQLYKAKKAGRKQVWILGSGVILTDGKDE